MAIAMAIAASIQIIGLGSMVDAFVRVCAANMKHDNQKF